jgi:hypothetical protein
MSERAEVLPVTRLVIAIDNSVIQMLGRDAGGDRPYLRDLQQCRLSTYPLHNYLGYYALIICGSVSSGTGRGRRLGIMQTKKPASAGRLLGRKIILGSHLN